MVRPGDRRCPHCQSDKWIPVEPPRTVTRKNPETSREESREIPRKFGCANCGGEFYVEKALEWKRTRDLKQCPHCGSRKIVVAIDVNPGVVIACLQCQNFALYEPPGCEGTISVDDVKRAGRLTDKAQQLFGERGFYYDVKRAKSRPRADDTKQP